MITKTLNVRLAGQSIRQSCYYSLVNQPATNCNNHCIINLYVSFSDGNVEWKLPSQMVICQDPLIQQVISAEMLEQHLGLFYLHNAVMSAGNTPLLQSLGIKQISTQHLLEIGKSLAKQWLEDDVDGKISRVDFDLLKD